MDYQTLFWSLMFYYVGSSAGADTRTSFVKSFVINEEKPTFIIMCDLCWSKREIVLLATEVSNLGGRVSMSLANRMKYQDHDLLFLLDLDCPHADQVIEMATTKGLFKRPYRWLVLSNPSEETNVTLLWESPLLADSDLVLAERKDDVYVMTELHKPSRNQSMVLTPRGHFAGGLVDRRPRRELFRRRMDLRGHPLTMANVIQDSNSSQYHLPREDGLEYQNDAIAKVSWMNARVAFEMLNATPRYIFSYRWGYKVRGRWSGMIQDLNTGRADVGTNCVVTNRERLSVVAYTDTIAPFRVRFVFRQPPLSYVANIYSLPFSSGLWYGTAACAAMSAAAVCVAAKWELRFGQHSTQLDGGLNDAVFWTMGAVSQQGSHMQTTRTPGRIIEWVVFTALMALYAAYSANIVVLLQAPSQSVRSLAQLAASKITLAANDVDYNHFIFKQYTDPIRRAIYKKIEPEKGKHQFYDLNDGVERIRRGLFAFHSIEEQIYRRIEETFQAHEKCDLMDIDFMNAFNPYAPMKKDSPYLELIRVAFKRIRETGVQSALSRRFRVPKPECGTKGAAFSSVGVSDLTPVLCLMAIGAGASVAVLIVEIVVFHATQNMKKRQQGIMNEK